MGERAVARGAATWRLLIDEAANASWNMAADEAMLSSLASADSLPTLRFYAWNPAAVSIGYFQKADAEIDRAACAVQGIDVVRRLTGGRAVLHEEEVTYSLVVSEDAPYVPSGVTESYLYFSRAIVFGLARLGIEAQMQEPGRGSGPSGKHGRSAACFDAPSHYELTVGGRKVAGSAQVRKEGVLLQHGSILLRFRPERMAGILRFDNDEERMAMTAELAGRATDLSEAAGRDVGFDEVVWSVRLGMEAECGLLLEPGGRTALEMAVLKELAGKYGSQEWNLRR